MCRLQNTSNFKKLRYFRISPALEELVDNRIEIPKDSEMEIEIRANIIAIKELSKKFGNQSD